MKPNKKLPLAAAAPAKPARNVRLSPRAPEVAPVNARAREVAAAASAATKRAGRMASFSSTWLSPFLALFKRSEARGPVDGVLAATVVALIGFGVVMVYSASAIEATVKYKDAEFFLKRQSIYAVLGLIAMWAASRMDYRKARVLTYPILISVIVMLTLCVTGFGHKAGNAYRWLNVGPVNIQPAETAKLGIVFWLAYSLSKKADKIKSFGVGFLPHLLVCGFLGMLCLRQPDFGSAFVMLVLTFTLLFIAGARIPYIVAAAGALGTGAAMLVRFSGYRYARYLAWLDINAHRNDSAYQPFQSVMSFGSGNFTGLGLGRGLQVLYLPEAHTDFISAIIGEELGFIGVCLLACTYLVLVSRGIKIALEAQDDYGSFLAFGISTLFGVQSLINFSVAMAIAPTKGLTLPFLSYGGSSLLVNAAAVGVLLSISRKPVAVLEAGAANRKLEPDVAPGSGSGSGIVDELEGARA